MLSSKGPSKTLTRRRPRGSPPPPVLIRFRLLSKMRAVTGSISSSKPISLSKAAAILSKFTAADTGAGRDLADHLRRASNAFNDLVERHRELRVERRKGGDGNPVQGEAKRTRGDLGELERKMRFVPLMEGLRRRRKIGIIRRGSILIRASGIRGRKGRAERVKRRIRSSS